MRGQWNRGGYPLPPVQGKIAGFFAAAPIKVHQLGALLSDVLDEVQCYDDCRSLSTAGSRSMFPLPVSGIVQGDHPNSPFLQAIAKGLNSLHGEACPKDFTGTKTSREALKRVASKLEGHLLLSEELPQISFDDFFRFRGIDYQGDEIKLARKVTWEGIEPSLPEQVASLDLRDFCEGVVLHYVNNIHDYLLPEDVQALGPTPKVMVDQCEWKQVAEGLVERGLCDVLSADQLFHVRERPVLNGMFAVSKQEFKGNIEICRLIMNLKPLNALCFGLQADTGTLPAITSMGGFFLQEDELLCLSSEDIRCFFYFFKVPRNWIPLLAFARAAPSSLTTHLGEDTGYLCARVLPMGFVNSVGIAQHVHRNVIKKSLGAFPYSLGGESEIRRDRTAPQGSNLYRIYLDNFDEMRKVDRKLAATLEGQPSPLVNGVREQYELAGLPRHPKKSVVQQLQGEVQGAWVDGVKGTVVAKPNKIVKYIALALELIKDCKASQKELQVVGGGMVYAAMFRRPALCGLNHIWRDIVSLDQKPQGVRVYLRKEVVMELARFICLLPLMYIDFRAPFDESLTASDASTTGGGI